MMKRVAWFYVVASICCACGNVDSVSEDSIAGVYVREYSKEILNQLSGSKVGVRTIRDTIVIRPMDDGYQVDNSKWRMNDYDNDGWSDMEHAEGGPLPTFIAKYDEKTTSLNSKAPGLVPSFFIDEKKGLLSVGEKSGITFTKIK